MPGENPEGALETVLGRPGELAVEAAKILVLERIEEAHSDEAVARGGGLRRRGPRAHEGGPGGPAAHPAADHRSRGRARPRRRRVGRAHRARRLPRVDRHRRREHVRDAGHGPRRRGEGARLQRRTCRTARSRCSRGRCRRTSARCCRTSTGSASAPTWSSTRAGTSSRAASCAASCARAAKLTYGGVARALGLSGEAPREPAADAMVEGLRVALRAVAPPARAAHEARARSTSSCRRRRSSSTRRRASRSTSTRRARRTPGVKKAYQLIEELMLLGNETVARWCQERDIPTIYRVHAAARRAEARSVRGDVRGARHRLRRRGHARPEEARGPAQVVQRPPAGAGPQLAPAAVDEAGDVRRRQRRPLRPRVEGVPALHLAHPPLPGPRRAPHGARGPPAASRRAATARRARSWPRRRSRRASPSAARWRSSARSSTFTARS